MEKNNERKLNLTENFYPLGKCNEIKFQKFNFPSGIEKHIKLEYNRVQEKLSVPIPIIVTKITSSEDIIEILLANDALKNFYKHIDLFIPYIAYGRQDRKTSKEEPFSLKVFADLINSQNFNKIYTFDPHSDVTGALINNLEIIKNFKLVEEVLLINGVSLPEINIVCPDAGAYKKIFDVCEKIGYSNDIVVCNKVRDISTGDIKSITVNTDDLGGKDCYIVDDICSRGGTFIGIAKELRERNCGKIFLIVSHFESIHNVENLSKYIDKIYTTDSIIEDDIEKNGKFAQIDIIKLETII